MLEFLGVVLICSTALITHHNPLLVALSVYAALMIGNGKVESYFSPLVVGLQYSMGRMSGYESLKHLAIQAAAILAVSIAFKF
jgi:hypothetical protein